MNVMKQSTMKRATNEKGHNGKSIKSSIQICSDTTTDNLYHIQPKRSLKKQCY